MNEPVTKADLESAVHLIKVDLKADLEAAVRQIKEYVDERTHDAETRLLRAFADFNTASDIRFRKLEADGSNVNANASLRLGELERRVADIDIRVLGLEGKRPKGN